MKWKTSKRYGTIYSNEKKIASDTNSYNLDVKEQEIDGHKFTGNIEFESIDTIWKHQPVHCR